MEIKTLYNKGDVIRWRGVNKIHEGVVMAVSISIVQDGESIVYMALEGNGKYVPVNEHSVIKEDGKN